MAKVFRGLVFLLAVVACAGWGSAVQADEWTDYATTTFLRTYGDADQLQIKLEGIDCPNLKSYFHLLPPYSGDDMQTLRALALMAHATQRPLRLRFASNINTTHCYITGIELK